MISHPFISGGRSKVGAVDSGVDSRLYADLCSEPPYVLEMDASEIQDYDSRQRNEAKLVLDSIPEPYIGNSRNGHPRLAATQSWALTERS